MRSLKVMKGREYHIICRRQNLRKRDNALDFVMQYGDVKKLCMKLFLSLLEDLLVSS